MYPNKVVHLTDNEKVIKSCPALWSQFILPDPTYDGGGYHPASPEEYSVNTVDQQLSGSCPEELSINAVNQLAMAGLVESSHQQFQGQQLHHLQPPAALGLVKQEYQPELGELNYAQHFDNPAEPGSRWSQDVKVEQETSIQYQPTSVGHQKNFSQERQVEEGPLTSQYAGGHQRPEYSYDVGGFAHYRDTVEYKDAMYNISSSSSMAGQQQQQQYNMDSQQQLGAAGFTEMAPYQVPTFSLLTCWHSGKTSPCTSRWIRAI